jgi:hypothetical protein
MLATAMPDRDGSGRNAIDFEPLSGPGPVMTLTRLPNGTRDIDKLVGDYNNPILKPQTAERANRKRVKSVMRLAKVSDPLAMPKAARHALGIDAVRRTRSRLQGEPASGVDDFRIHPMEPPTSRLGVRVSL